MNVMGRSAAMLRRVVDAALVALIALALIGVFFARMLPMLGPTTLVMRGPSMAPAIPAGAVVVAAPVDPAALRVGDVVSIKVGPQRAIFTHRVVRVVPRQGETWIETKGDANANPDPAIVPASSVIGRVDLAMPVVGYLIVLLSSLSGVLLLVGLAATLWVGAWLLETIELDAADDAGGSLPTRRRAAGTAVGRVARG